MNEDRYSYEEDALGSITVRDGETGKSKFIQGAEATKLADRLKTAGPNRDAVLAPLVESELVDEPDSFEDEITATSGSYNFPWRFNGRHGLGTVMFKAGGKEPLLRLISVRDIEGNEIEPDPLMKDALLQQARAFINDA